MNTYNIDENTARIAQELNSFSDYKENSATNEYIDFDEIYGLLGELNYQQGKEAAILKMVYTYTNEEGNEVHYYAYTIKMLSDLKVKSIRFYN